MRLLNDATSPFGRKVMVAALERAIPLVEEFVDLTALESVALWNPLRQIPVLIMDDGRAVFDSMTILLFLDSQHQNAPLFPDADRWGVMTRAALCDGLMEAVLQRVVERKRAAEEQSPAFIAKLEARIADVLDELETGLAKKPEGSEPLLADDIAAVCALGYVDFRYTHEWRASRPAAAAWFAAYETRPSLRKTAPVRTSPATHE